MKKNLQKKIALSFSLILVMMFITVDGNANTPTSYVAQADTEESASSEVQTSDDEVMEEKLLEESVPSPKEVIMEEDDSEVE